MIESAIKALIEFSPVVTLLAVYITYRVVLTVRENDLKHVDEKLNLHHAEIKGLLVGLDRRLVLLEDQIAASLGRERLH